MSSKLKNITFVAGVHGSGKSTYCKFEKEKTGIAHFSCSEIIKEKRKLGEQKKKLKIAKNVEANQPDLIDYLNNEIEESEIILDGHFSLFTENYEIHALSKKTFLAIPIKSIIITIADPKCIVDRLLLRDGVKHPVEHINKLQDVELSRAKLISSELGVRLIIIDTTNLA